MLQLPGGSESQQVMLQVRFAEVNRRALTELGLSLFANVASGICGRASTTQQFAAPGLRRRGAERTACFSDFLNLFFFDSKDGIGGVVKRAAAERASSRAWRSRT